MSRVSDEKSAQHEKFISPYPKTSSNIYITLIYHFCAHKRDAFPKGGDAIYFSIVSADNLTATIDSYPEHPKIKRTGTRGLPRKRCE